VEAAVGAAKVVGGAGGDAAHAHATTITNAVRRRLVSRTWWDGRKTTYWENVVARRRVPTDTQKPSDGGRAFGSHE
jgi:hypothetical protein